MQNPFVYLGKSLSDNGYKNINKRLNIPQNKRMLNIWTCHKEDASGYYTQTVRKMLREAISNLKWLCLGVTKSKKITMAPPYQQTLWKEGMLTALTDHNKWNQASGDCQTSLKLWLEASAMVMWIRLFNTSEWFCMEKGSKIPPNVVSNLITNYRKRLMGVIFRRVFARIKPGWQ